MEPRRRAYQSAGDWPAMLAVAQAQPGDQLHLADLPYRLCSWAFDEPANCALWHDAGGRALAWACLQTPFWCIDYAVDPAAPPGTLELALRWADERARAIGGTPFGRPIWFINGFAGHPHAHTIEALGFHSQADVGEDSWSKVLLQRDAAGLPERRALPDGFQIRPLGGAAEVEAYVALHRAVFESENMTVAWRERTLRHPAYQPALDLVLVDPEQRLAGFCVGWRAELGHDQRPAGQVEPMGVRADLRGRGLGRALLAECMHRLRDAGAHSLSVETDNFRDAAFQHYRAAGFEVLRDVTVYRRDYPAGAG